MSRSILRNALKTKQKNSEGLIPVACGPPAPPPEPLSQPIHKPENRVVSKRFGDLAGNRTGRSERQMFSLQPPFSRTWELRQFSTQLTITAFSMGCRAGGWVLFRTSDRPAKRSVNVPTTGDPSLPHEEFGSGYPVWPQRRSNPDSRANWMRNRGRSP